MWEYILPISIIVIIIVLYVVTSSINEKTKKPDGCEDIECNGCNAKSCNNRK